LTYAIAFFNERKFLLSLSVTLATAYGLLPDSVSIIALIVTGETSGAQRDISASFNSALISFLIVFCAGSRGGVITFVF